jgi:hypothetical protein
MDPISSRMIVARMQPIPGALVNKLYSVRPPILFLQTIFQQVDLFTQRRAGSAPQKFARSD